MTPRDAIPRSWLDFLKSSGRVGIGLDLATSDGPVSNPASITVTQETDGRLFERLVIAWKTKDEAVTRQMFGLVLSDLASINATIRAACIDASNEVFFAQILAKEFRRYCTIHLIKGGENLTFQGQTMRSKELLGNLYVNAHADNLLATPEGPFLKEDRRLVQKSKGLFVTMTGKAGEHGDTFDSGKLARWALLTNGPAEALAIGLSAAPHHQRSRYDITAEEEDAIGFGEALGLSC